MNNLIKTLICILELLQKFPYEKAISFLKTLLNAPKPEREHQKLEISFKNESVFIGDIEIINRKSTNLYRIFRILLDQFLLDAVGGKDFCNFTRLNINDIAKRMEKRFNIAILDGEKQIRRPINRLQQIFKDKLSSTVAVIISKHWEGADDKNFGYGINPQTICFGAKNEDHETAV
jgi:hypothetical protein